MFKQQPMLYYVVPKNKHFILSGLATMLTMFASAVVGLSIGTDHWRESQNPGYNVSLVIQGLIQECDRDIISIDCKKITSSRFITGLLGTLEIVYGLLIESLVLALMALFLSVLASFHKKHILVTAVISMEITSALIMIFAVSIYTHYFIKDSWKIGWSYGLAWLSIFCIASAPFCHYIVQDVKFLGKKVCI